MEMRLRESWVLRMMVVVWGCMTVMVLGENRCEMRNMVMVGVTARWEVGRVSKMKMIAMVGKEGSEMSLLVGMFRMRTREVGPEMVTMSKVLVGSRMLNMFELGTRVMMDMTARWEVGMVSKLKMIAMVGKEGSEMSLLVGMFRMRTKEVVPEMVTMSKVLVGSRMLNMFEMGTRVMMDMMIEELMAMMNMSEMILVGRRRNKVMVMARGEMGSMSKRTMSEMVLMRREMGYMFEMGTKVMMGMLIKELVGRMSENMMTVSGRVAMEDYKTMAEGLGVVVSKGIRLMFYMVVGEMIEMTSMMGLTMWEMLGMSIMVEKADMTYTEVQVVVDYETRFVWGSRMLVDYKMMSVMENNLMEVCGVELYKVKMGKPIMIVTDVGKEEDEKG
jgi:hypothetical protein